MEQVIEKEKMILLKAGLERVKQEFVSSLPGRVAELDGLMDDLYGMDTNPRDVIKEIGYRAHKLHGQAGSFGYGEIGIIAAKLEMTVVSALEGPLEAGIESVEVQLIDLLDQIDASLDGV